MEKSHSSWTKDGDKVRIAHTRKGADRFSSVQPLLARLYDRRSRSQNIAKPRGSFHDAATAAPRASLNVRADIVKGVVVNDWIVSESFGYY